jgi:hypothetical protein
MNRLLEKYLGEIFSPEEKKIISSEADKMSASELKQHLTTYEKHQKTLLDNLKKFDADPDKKKDPEGREIYTATKQALQAVRSSIPILRAALQRKKQDKNKTK